MVAPSRITGPNRLQVVLPKDESFRRVLMQAIVDVDVYLTVARSLMVGDLQPLALNLEHIDLHSEFNMLVRHARDELAQLRLLIKGTLLFLRWQYTHAWTHVCCVHATGQYCQLKTPSSTPCSACLPGWWISASLSLAGTTPRYCW